MEKFKKLFVRRYLAVVLTIVGIVGISTSVVLYNREAKPPKISSDVSSVRVSPAPSSNKPKPKNVAAYSVPPTDPKYIAIPAIGIVNTPVVELGLLSSGAIATPDNIYETGWYDGSSKPGQAGAMFIYGHVSSWTADGIFYNLKQLVSGDKVIITTGDNTIYTYQVTSSIVYPYNAVNMNQVLLPVDPDVPGLNLMTCTGQVIPGTSEFNKRLVVFTNLVNG